MASQIPDMSMKTQAGPDLPRPDSAPARQKKSRRGALLRLAISIGLIGLMLVVVDFRNLVQSLTGLNPWYLAASAVLLHLDRGLMAYKWNLLLVKLDVRAPQFVLFRTYMAAPLFQVVLPSTVGTDLFRFYVLSRLKVNAQAVFASMILERLLGLAAIVLLVLLSFGLAFYALRDDWLEVMGMGWTLVVAAIVGTGLIIAAGFGLMALISKLPERLSRRFKLDKLRHIYSLSSEYRKHPVTVAKVFAWTLLGQLLPIGVLYLMAYSIHLDISFIELAVIAPLTTLALRLPISLDGLGVQEGMYVLLFGMVGVLPAEAFLLSMLRRVVPMLCALPWALHHLYCQRLASSPDQPVGRLDAKSA